MGRDYHEFAWHFRALADAQREGKLVFVLGAGVSKPHDLPDWSRLLCDLLLNSGRLPRLQTRSTEHEDIDKNLERERKAVLEILNVMAPDPLIQGAIARAAYPQAQWPRALHEQLWREHKGSGTSDVLQRIGRMVVDASTSHKDAHVSVLTFNYDDLLELQMKHALQLQGMDDSLLTSVATEEEFERTWLTPGIYVYHLHGFLGGKDTPPDSKSETVLDADSYVPVLSGNHWSWRCMDRVLTGSGQSSLFIGLSLADPSLRLVLTRRARWRTPMTAVYLAPCPVLPDVRERDVEEETSVADSRVIAMMYRALMDIYAAVLDELYLVCYHLTSWDEISHILRTVEEGK